MTFRDDAVAAVEAGQNAGMDDENPYLDGPSLLARIWERGWMTMATIRTATGPGRAAFLSGDTATG